MRKKPYLDIVSHYESCLKRFGDSHLGVDWLNEQEAEIRYSVMLDVIRKEEHDNVEILDFGCGTAGLYDYILRTGLEGICYGGLDISPEFVKVSRRKYPNLEFLVRDVLEAGASLGPYDYVVMNGVFTEKGNLTFDEMREYCFEMIVKVFGSCRRAVAFNARSSHVVTESQDLFHLPLDDVAGFLVRYVSKNFVIRNDYGLEEYTVYVYR